MDGAEKNKLIGIEILHHLFELISCYALYTEQWFYFKFRSWIITEKQRLYNIHMCLSLCSSAILLPFYLRIYDFKMFYVTCIFLTCLHIACHLFFNRTAFFANECTFQEGIGSFIL